MKRSFVLVIAAIAAIFVGLLAPSYATNAPPKVSFKVTSGPPVSGATVALRARASDDGPPPLRYRWVVVSQPDGGGVTFGTAFTKARTTSFTPAVAGEYEIKVIAKDGSGRKGSKTKTVVVTSSQTMGNGIIEDPEECDDADANSGDGCSSEGVIEYAYYCSGEPSTCSTMVGDGLIGGIEQCDDADTTSGDGCSSEGVVEPGYMCLGEPSFCMPDVPVRRSPVLRR